jgi:hypothetical protein
LRDTLETLRGKLSNSETTSPAWRPPKKGISEPRSGRRQCAQRAVNPRRRLEWVQSTLRTRQVTIESGRAAKAARRLRLSAAVRAIVSFRVLSPPIRLIMLTEGMRPLRHQRIWDIAFTVDAATESAFTERSCGDAYFFYPSSLGRTCRFRGPLLAAGSRERADLPQGQQPDRQKSSGDNSKYIEC